MFPHGTLGISFTLNTKGKKNTPGFCVGRGGECTQLSLGLVT